MGVITKLPKKINAMRVVTYAVDDELLEDIVEANELTSKEDVTPELLLDYLEDFIYEDFNDKHRLDLPIHVQDEWGENLRDL